MCHTGITHPRQLAMCKRNGDLVSTFGLCPFFPIEVAERNYNRPLNPHDGLQTGP